MQFIISIWIMIIRIICIVPNSSEKYFLTAGNFFEKYKNIWLLCVKDKKKYFKLGTEKLTIRQNNDLTRFKYTTYL